MDDDLTDSLAGLSVLLTGHRPTRETLTEIATFAVNAIPGADGAGLTMIESGQPQTVVASVEFVRAVDEIQYALEEGPCLLAVATGETQVSGSLGGEARWPRFGPRVSRLGVHSVLSLPLLLPDQVVGALNVYAHAKDAFGEHAVHTGELFARPAAVSVHNALVLGQSQRLAGQLSEALVSRAVIDQALGILMSRTGGTSQEALERLRSLSRAENTKLSSVAQALVDESVRRARSRHADVPEA